MVYVHVLHKNKLVGSPGPPILEPDSTKPSPFHRQCLHLIVKFSPNDRENAWYKHRLKMIVVSTQQPPFSSVFHIRFFRWCEHQCHFLPVVLGMIIIPTHIFFGFFQAADLLRRARPRLWSLLWAPTLTWWQDMRRQRLQGFFR